MSSSAFLNRIEGAITTTDATPTTILAVPANEPDISMRISISVAARRSGGSDADSWNQILLVDKTSGGTPTMVGSQTIAQPVGSLGASSWAIGAAFDTTHVYLQVTGQAASTINWLAAASAMCVMGD
jgi:hypothetical protein